MFTVRQLGKECTGNLLLKMAPGVGLILMMCASLVAVSRLDVMANCTRQPCWIVAVFVMEMGLHARLKLVHTVYNI